MRMTESTVCHFVSSTCQRSSCARLRSGCGNHLSVQLSQESMELTRVKAFCILGAIKISGPVVILTRS